MVILGLALARPSVVRAKTFHCSAGDVQCLIAAIKEANTNGTTNRIRLEAGTYTLTAVDNDMDGPNGLPSITSPRALTIQGAGAESTILARDTSAPGFRLFHVAATGALTLHGLTGRRGEAFLGGGIWNRGTLLLHHTMLASNVATGSLDPEAGAAGGGIYNVDGQVMLIDSTVAENQTTGDFMVNGGGLWNGGTLTITHSILTKNAARGKYGSGGAIFNQGTATITKSTLAANAVETGRGGAGGGITNLGALTISSSTLATNSADGLAEFGGGIDNHGTLTISSSTLAANSARGFFFAYGGGISNSGTLTISNSTVAGNSVGEDFPAGGGLFNDGMATLQNTILASNTSASGPDCFGPVTSLDHNLIGDAMDCAVTRGSHDLTGDPGLGDFRDDGTPGHGHFPLLPTSQAIDAGNDVVCPRRDQRGQRRVNIRGVGTSICDMGAIEFHPRGEAPGEESD